MARILSAVVAVVLTIGSNGLAAEQAAQAPAFRVGFGKRDITPQAPVPMWGYSARHNALSQGALDPLFAKAIVVEAGTERLAIVGLDIGRGPTEPMMEKIRREIGEKAGVKHVLISGSHTHHGPVIELTDRPGFGKGTYDDAVAYAQKLPDLLIEAIVEASQNLHPARIGVGTKDLNMNRNRHTKRMPKATDPMLAVVRFDDLEGKPLAILVNFAAHPVMTEGSILKFSADYPGFMQNKVEAGLATNCVFMQGASGDMSPNPREENKGPKLFGEDLGNEVLGLAKSIETKVPDKPSLQGQVDRLNFSSRANFKDPLLAAGLSLAFFPELIQNFFAEWKDGIRPELNTIILNGDLALVGGSGEFFCNHSNRLKQRSYVPHTLFFGYCNGHHMYFPTIEAVSERGYGADPAVSPVEIGAGERMMDQALINIYTMLGRFETKFK